MKKITYYLIADIDIIDLYENEGLNSLIEQDCTYSKFAFIEGETNSEELAQVLEGDYYLNISEYEYNRLQN